MEMVLLIVAVLMSAAVLVIVLMKGGGTPEAELSARINELRSEVSRYESLLKEEMRRNREENSSQAKSGREELANVLKEFRTEMSNSLTRITESNQKALESLNKNVEEKLTKLIEHGMQNNNQLRDALNSAFKNFSENFDKNVKSFNDLQRDKFSDLEKKQEMLLKSTEDKLERMREMVDEKLQKTLNERLGQSFEQVSKHLKEVQQGLGEMKTLAQDVGGLKKVLSNVKTRGNLGEYQLAGILEQILSRDQYELNVATKKGSAERVEFAVKWTKEEDNTIVYIPIDSKFPIENYHSLQNAYETADVAAVEEASKLLEAVIRKQAKDIRDKYLDPPNTTDFAIMFLPVEGLYAEVIRRTSLVEVLHREYRVVVTGPATLVAILNSLQMAFRTLAIQKRSGEVWKVLGAVKTEFEKFGGMLEKAQKNLQTASTQLDEVIGTRTKAIQRKLKDVESLPASEAKDILPQNGELNFEEKVE